MTEGAEKRREVNILLVEDNAADVLLTKEILSESEGTSYQISVARDGADAISYLRKMDGHGHEPRPDLILLDLNMPRMHGLDLLSRIKKDSELQSIPVCVLTTSVAVSDREGARESGAECYLTKPLDLDELESSFQSILDDSRLP